MSKKVCIFEYSEEEWQEYCRKHKAEWKAFGEKIKKYVSSFALARSVQLKKQELAFIPYLGLKVDAISVDLSWPRPRA